MFGPVWYWGGVLAFPINNCIAVTLAGTSAYVTDRCRHGDKEVTLKLWVHLSARISLVDIDNCAKGGTLGDFESWE
jgi:hypothetical protein